MRLDDDDRFELLKLEMGLVQATLDKYDDLIFRSRNWFVTIWIGLLGLTINQEDFALSVLATIAAALYWFIEGMMRHQYWYKYVVRYRALREWVNSDDQQPISVYDLTNSRGSQPDVREKIEKCFLKTEPSIVYSLMAIAAIAVGLAVT